MAAGFSVRVDGLQETLDSLRGIETDLRKEANSEIRLAAKAVAGSLVVALQGAAAASGVPVAPRVASSAKVKSDRFPTVVIGGSKKVGRRGAPASALVWGSENGPRGSVNHFGVPPGSGYWIAPTVERIETSRAVPEFTQAIEAIVHRYRLGE